MIVKRLQIPGVDDPSPGAQDPPNGNPTGDGDSRPPRALHREGLHHQPDLHHLPHPRAPRLHILVLQWRGHVL